MVGIQFVVAATLGALAAFAFVAFVDRRRQPVCPLAAGLVVAALIYVLFAAIGGSGPAVGLEAGGALGFTAIAAASRYLGAWPIAMGWVAHAAWDLLLHPVTTPSHAPGWYPALCLGFDLVVAGYALALALAPVAGGED